MSAANARETSKHTTVRLMRTSRPHRGIVSVLRPARDLAVRIGESHKKPSEGISRARRTAGFAQQLSHENVAPDFFMQQGEVIPAWKMSSMIGSLTRIIHKKAQTSCKSLIE